MARSAYPPDWDQRRQAVYRRDGYQCIRCSAMGGSKGNAELHAHHVVPKSKGGSDALNNLVTLCAHCHSNVHGRPVGSMAMQPSQSRTNEHKWGSLLSHVIVFVLTFWTFGLGNLVWALICRGDYTINRFLARLKP